MADAQTTENPQPGDLEAVVERLRSALRSGDLTLIGEVLDPSVTWGTCAGRESVLDMLASAATVASADSVTFEVVDTRLIATIEAGSGHEPLTLALFVRDGMLVEIIDAVDRSHALVLAPLGELETTAARGWQPSRLSPVLPIADLTEAIERFESLGFEVHAYDGDAAYAFASRGSVELHLAQLDDLDPLTNTTAVYLYVDDADATYAAWRVAGVEGRLHPPADTPYGLREGAYVDPDGNLLRFGSAIDR